jgi:hypothetical protein
MTKKINELKALPVQFIPRASRAKPELHVHVKLPTVLRHSPFIQIPGIS